MPGGLFFPPPIKMSASNGHTVEYHRALAAIFPLGFMTVLMLVCLLCAGCFGKRKRKAKEHESPAQRPLPNPSRPLPFPVWGDSRDSLLHTPSESSGFQGGPHSFDFMNMSFGYGNDSTAARPELEEAYEAPRDSPAQTTTPPFARLRPTPPGLFKKEEDDQPAESRSPSPKTLIREGKKMRYGAWVRRTPSTSSGTSDTSQSTLFPWSFSDDELKTFVKDDEERKAKDRKKLLREKRRLKKEAREDQADKIWRQINWTVKDEYDQLIRESKAINIPPRKRIEEHPEFQKVVRAMFEEKHAEFDATTVLNSVWEKGRMEDFLRENQMGAVGGVPAEDFSTLLRDVKEEPEDDTQPLLPEAGTKSEADGLSRYHVKEDPETEASHHGARRKVLPEAGAKSKTDVSQYYLKEVPVTEAEDKASLHGARRKVLPEAGAKGDVFQPSTYLPIKRLPPGNEESQPLLHPHGARSKVPKKRKASVDSSQPLFHHYGAGKNYGTMLPEVRPMGVFTRAMMDTRVPLVRGKEFEEKRLAETRKVSSKIAKAVFDIEMKRVEDQRVQSHLKTVEKGGEKHVVEIHPEPSGLIRRKPSPVVEENLHVVEIHQEPSGLIRRKPSPVVEENLHVVEIHLEPSGLIRRKQSLEETVIDLGDEDTSSSWEDLAPKQKYIWWPGIAGRKKKGAKKKKYDKK